MVDSGVVFSCPDRNRRKNAAGVTGLLSQGCKTSSTGSGRLLTSAAALPPVFFVFASPSACPNRDRQRRKAVPSGTFVNCLYTINQYDHGYG